MSELLSRRGFLKAAGAALAATLLPIPPRPDSSNLKDPIPRVYGKDSSLTQKDFAALKESFRAQIKSGERLMDPNTVYLTTLIEKDLYNTYSKKYGEPYEAFLARQIREYNSMLRWAPYGNIKAIEAREIIVISPDVQVTSSHHAGYITDGFPGSDGVWRETDTMAPWGEPHETFDRIHWKHEVWHILLRGIDGYALTYEFLYESSTPDCIKDLPISWKGYASFYRNDIGGKGDITQSARGPRITQGPVDRGGYVNTKIGTWAALLLQRRVREGKVHDIEDTLADYVGFRTDIPQKVSLRFRDNRGIPIDISEMKIYRTQPADEQRVAKVKQDKALASTSYAQVINPNPIYTATANELSPNDLFKTYEDNAGEYSKPVVTVRPTEAILLVRIEAKNGKKYFRWMDVRDFQIPYWLGYEKRATLSMEVNSLSETRQPDRFNWKITYNR